MNRNNLAVRCSVIDAFELDDMVKDAVLIGKGIPRTGKVDMRVLMSAISDGQLVYPVTIHVEQIPGGSVEIVGAETLSGIDRQRLRAYSIKKA